MCVTKPFTAFCFAWKNIIVCNNFSCSSRVHHHHLVSSPWSPLGLDGTLVLDRMDGWMGLWFAWSVWMRWITYILKCPANYYRITIAAAAHGQHMLKSRVSPRPCHSIPCRNNNGRNSRFYYRNQERPKEVKEEQLTLYYSTLLLLWLWFLWSGPWQRMASWLFGAIPFDNSWTGDVDWSVHSSLGNTMRETSQKDHHIYHSSATAAGEEIW